MTAEAPAYAIIGRGRWAGVLRGALEREGRRVSQVEDVRRREDESDDEYRGRISEAVAATGAGIAWLAALPGPHSVILAQAALEHAHLISEKPWAPTDAESRALSERAARGGRIASVHYQFCFLDELTDWRDRFEGGRGHALSGIFTTSKPNRLGLPADANLGAHVVAIREAHVPDARLGAITSGYDSADARAIWLDRGDHRVDFTRNAQPLIQRFFAAFEAGTRGGAFPYDLEFACRVRHRTRDLG